MTVSEEFIRVSRYELEQGRAKIDACLAKLSDEQIWSHSNEIENSVGNLVIHLAGNARQWIIAGIGGADDDRDRDSEFNRRDAIPGDELRSTLAATMLAVDQVLGELDPATLLEIRKIQIYELTILQSIYHVTQHFGGHVGQIIWATKRMTAEDLGFYRYLTPEGGGAPPENAQP